MDKILETIKHEFSKSNDVINLAKQYQNLSISINDIFVKELQRINARNEDDGK